MGLIETRVSPGLRGRLRGFRGRREAGLPTELYRDNLAAIIRTLRRLGIAESELPDVAHEVFVIAVRKREELHGVGSPRAWLFSVARKVASNHRRKRNNRLERELAWATGGPADSETQPELELDLQTFLGTLNEPEREAFVLGQLEGMTRTELAEALDVAEGTAYGRLRRARQQLDGFFANDERREEAVEDDERRHRLALSALLPLLPIDLVEAAPVGATASAASSWGLGHVLTGFAATLAVAVPVALATTLPDEPGPQVEAPVAVASVHSAPLQAQATEPEPEPEPESEPEPTANPEPEPEAVEVDPIAKPKPARAPRSKPEPALPSQVDEEAQASALKLEVRLMAEARSALARGDRKKADASLRRLRAERPRPSLAEEAEALHTEYECRYRSEAQGAGSFVAFVTRFPNSAYAKSLKSVCPRVDDDQ